MKWLVLHNGLDARVWALMGAISGQAGHAVTADFAAVYSSSQLAEFMHGFDVVVAVGAESIGHLVGEVRDRITVVEMGPADQAEQPIGHPDPAHPEAGPIMHDGPPHEHPHIVMLARNAVQAILATRS